MGQLNEVFQQEVTNIKHSVGLANTTTGKGFALVGGIAVVGAVSFATVVEVVSFPFWVVGRGIEIAEEKKRQKRLIAEDKAAKEAEKAARAVAQHKAKLKADAAKSAQRRARLEANIEGACSKSAAIGVSGSTTDNDDDKCARIMGIEAIVGSLAF